MKNLLCFKICRNVPPHAHSFNYGLIGKKLKNAVFEIKRFWLSIIEERAKLTLKVLVAHIIINYE